MITPHNGRRTSSRIRDAARFRSPRGSKVGILDFDRPVSYCLRGLESQEGEGA